MAQGGNRATRFALPYDAPWLGLKSPESEYAPMEGDAEDEAERRKADVKVVAYRGEPLRLAVPSSGGGGGGGGRGGGEEERSAMTTT